MPHVDADDGRGSGEDRAPEPVFDVIVIGGGPAGLSGALVLGRCSRRVMVIDDGRPRAERSRAVHGFLSRDGVPPFELRRIAREQLEPYGVVLLEAHVETVMPTADGFRVRAGGRAFTARRLLIATGMRDRMPPWPGVEELRGTAVFQCPYCDGWENRERALGAYAPDDEALSYVLGLLHYSRDIVLFTDGVTLSDEHQRHELSRHGISLCEEPVVELERNGPHLIGMRLASGRLVPREALFVHAGQEQHAPFAQQLGCELSQRSTVLTGKNERTRASGVYVAGDASMDLQCVAVAAAEGYKAAVGIHRELAAEERERAAS